MDPLTQGLIGAAAAQAAVGGRLPRAWLVGLLAGMAPDLDVFIRSEADPLMAIEYHRHFTHALVFIPLGGVLCALPWLLGRTWRAHWRQTLAASTLGVATHGLLDACTTYGTLLLWPFSRLRVGWDWISIIDPVFTLCLLVGVVWGALCGTRRPAVIGGALALLYLAAGAVQHGRALHAQQEIAAQRGHIVERGEVFPTLANQLVWRSLYLADGTIHADRIRVPWFGQVHWTPGASAAVVTSADLRPQEAADPRVVRDFARFSWFADGWVARHPQDGSVYGDVRYSLQTNAFEPIWGVRFQPGQPVPVEWVSRTGDRELRLSHLWREVSGGHPEYRALRTVPAQPAAMAD